MGFWSSLKKKIKGALKKVWQGIKGAIRLIVRVVVTVVGAVLGIVDLFLGFINWPPKKLRLHIFILTGDKGPIVTPADLTPAIDFIKQTYKKRFNVKVLAYSKNQVEIIEEQAPQAALEVACDGSDLFGADGDFFADHLAGWNAIPIALTFPVTAFIISDIKDTKGCSLGPLTDYVLVDHDGVFVPSTLAHEVGHACNLWHSGTKSNLMYHPDDRGDQVKWFQRNLFRSSRHVTYW